MFKGTNKLWKVVALVLAVCMLPMAAFADGEEPTVATVSITTTAEDAAEAYTAGDPITIAGTTTSSTVTILAVRGGAAVEESALTSADVLAKVVYAGQKAAAEGAFSFSFTPLASVTGSMLTVFVGGTDVAELVTLSFEVAEPTPSLTAVWYEGEDVVLNLSKVTGAGATAWWDAINSFKVNGTALNTGTDCFLNPEGTQITFADTVVFTAPVTIEITTTDDVYSRRTLAGLTASKKPAGVITADAEYVAGTVTLTVANENDFGLAWEEALANEEATVTFGDVEPAYTYDAEANELQLILDATVVTSDAEEVTGTLTIEVEGYENTEKAGIKVVAPTVKDKALLATTLPQPEAVNAEDENNSNYTVTLPTLPDVNNGSTITWKVSVDGVAAVPAEVSEGKFTLVRDAAAKKTYALTAEITNAGYKPMTVAYDAIEINKLGAPAFGSISTVEILKGEDNVAGTDVVYADGVTLTAKAVGEEGVQATYAWTIGETPVGTGETYAPAIADISKTITVTATPVAPFEGEAVSATVTIVLDSEYVPEPTVAITNSKLTAGSNANVLLTEDETYKDAPGYNVEKSYVLYEVLAADAEDEEAAIAKVVAGEVEAKEDAKFSTAGSYAVVKATFTYSIAGTDFEAIDVYDAMLVAKKSSGGSTTGGATLPGAAKPSTPVEPEKPVEGDDEDEVSGDPIANGAAAFTDVDKETYAWAYDSIDALAKTGVIKGMTETTFGPELETTNAQVIALAVRIAGLAAEDATTEHVDAEHWAYEEIAIAEANDILGVFGDKVAAEEATTREVAFTLLYNALKAAGIEIPEVADAIEYTDASSIDPACVEAIEALTLGGIVNGMGDGTLAPKATITRAQLAKILGLASALVK